MQLDEKLFAQSVLEMSESDVFKEAMRRIDRRAFEDWQRTDPKDIETRERAWTLTYAVKRLTDELYTMASPATQERAEQRQEIGESAVLRRNPRTA